MTRQQFEKRILGSVVGATIGDAVGGAYEGWPGDIFARETGKEWIDSLDNYKSDGGSFGTWSRQAGKGEGTDDTRMNHIFIETVIEHGGEITSQRLANAYILRYEHPERYWPKRHYDIARQHMRGFYPVSCGWLDMECPLFPDVPPHALRTHSFGCRFPTLIGLLSLACAGCLYKNKPLEAYKKAFELSYFDVGYANEAVGLQAAAVSMAIGGITDMKAILRKLGKMDPYCFGQVLFGGSLNRIAKESAQLARQAKDPHHLNLLLSKKLMPLHIFDPIDTMTVCLASNAFAPDDPKEAILIAANHRDIDENGNLVKFRDNDCTAYVAGALAGALAGIDKLPADWVNSVLKQNKKAYGIDMEKNVHDFCKVVYE